ncbi:thioesterase family protein [Dactylonectria estremocensis]|uniref:Thioesterase family protein n=1 Tax=Dactylonectria estremocensis TaxID=1079267 RepID=A0A9P9J9J8_9HYPO|nr:thioesterase family protein [Dactylonectria estremocensis]
MSTSSITPDSNGIPAVEFEDPAQRLLDIVATHEAALDFQQRESTINQTRSPLALKPEDRPFHLVQGSLAGADKIVEPYVFTDDDAGSLLAFYHLGQRLAGHSGIVHGGVAATLLDECMGRACFPRLPNKIAVTAKLEVDYKRPIPVNSVVIVRADTIEVEGRKASVEATMSDLDGRDLVKAKALFIQPKWSAEMTQLM